VQLDFILTSRLRSLFLGSKVGISLTALGAGMSLVDASFLFKLNALVLPMQTQFSGIKCGTANATSEFFPDFMSARSSLDFAALLQWNGINSMGSQTFFEAVMKSPGASGQASVSGDGQSFFFRHAESASLVFLLKYPHFIEEVAVPSANSVAKQCSANSAACRSLTDGLLFASNASTQAVQCIDSSWLRAVPGGVSMPILRAGLDLFSFSISPFS
jgi:hypothetical protein